MENTLLMISDREAFQATEKCLLHDEQPSKRLRVLADEVWPHVRLFENLLKQQKTEQSPVHHPEGSVWEHTLHVVDEAAKIKQFSADARAFMWAALLHDIGKPAATRVRKGRITAYDHDKIGAKMACEFLLAMTDDTEFAQKTAMLVRYHMQILYVNKRLSFQDISGMKQKTDLAEIALLGYCDRLGRRGADSDSVRGEILSFLQRCDPNGKTELPL